MPWLWRPYVIAPIVAAVLGLPLLTLSVISADVGLTAGPNCEENADEERELLRRALVPSLPAQQEIRYRVSCPYRDGASASWSVGATLDEATGQLVAAGWSRLTDPVTGRPTSDLVRHLDADSDVIVGFMCESGTCEGHAVPG